ncbi:hypothetical protein FNV66_12575 [Streptomyces sp. S1D4-14]|nr:hypothetical protein FNV67_12980 [Streptomyces sp. S1D4-20]QDN66263.1 hypothetical protein FNV66_12575 [Streptomyces sp. S1D4-14]QDO48671.1 hypothetical protein FNV60_10830 [Streptomyces sp. RLB3-5]QDO58911.1 hypothetical protein FNV59_13070 [Streptomyces sp. RLB1-8]
MLVAPAGAVQADEQAMGARAAPDLGDRQRRLSTRVSSASPGVGLVVCTGPFSGDGRPAKRPQLLPYERSVG